jgi:N-acetylglucosaminyldiphosphoundecaprenol N-acetyl-beta-D-mannosaminyltransferase
LGTPVFFIGAGSGVADLAAHRLVERFPKARIVGTWAETNADAGNDGEAIRRIAASGARAVFVAFGAKGQVTWIDRNRERLAASGVRLAVGVGGAFDYLAGTAPRPPRLIRRVGLEWLWRLAREPWRWRRQLVLPRFAVLVAWARARQGRRS